MTTTTKTVSARLLEKYRYSNVEYIDWWDYIWAQFQEELKEKYHIEADDKGFRFSGFCSQGDGASFEYRVHSEDSDKFLRVSGLADHYPAMLRLAEDDACLLSIKSYRSSGNYSHECMVSADIVAECWADQYDAERQPLEYDIAVINDERVQHELGDFEKAVTDFMRDLMRDLYRQLEQEYDYLTSDEAVTDYIRDCGLDEDEDEDDEEDE